MLQLRHDPWSLDRPDYLPVERRGLVDALAAIGSEYHEKIYTAGLGVATAATTGELDELFERAQAVVDHSARAKLRSDGLAHAYNQLEFTESPPGLAVHRLPLMLEGQVAVLSSGLLAPAEVVALLEALRRSDLWRSDQQSYILYPDRQLPGFTERNLISPASWEGCLLFEAMRSAEAESCAFKRGLVGCSREGKTDFLGSDGVARTGAA